MTMLDAARRMAMMSNATVLELAEYTGTRSDRRFDAASAKRVLRARIANGEVHDLDYDRADALGLTGA